MFIKETLESLKSKFTSSNDIPVERAMITRKEYDDISSYIIGLAQWKLDTEKWKDDTNKLVKESKEKLELVCYLSVSNLYHQLEKVPVLSS